MCGRYSFIVSDDLGRRFRVHIPTLNLRSRFNVTPGQEMPVVYRTDENHLELMRWGLIPSWAQDPAIGTRLINARAETLAEKPSFRASFKRKRCLVPASGFYEWKRAGGENIPYYYHLKDTLYFSFAGLYDIWHDPAGGHEQKTYIIITTDANDRVSQVHDRMPVILRDEDEDDWLDGATRRARLEAMLTPTTDVRFTGYRVSKKVNYPENEGESLIEPVPEPKWW